MNEGWKCPVCGRGVAPSEKHCEHGGSQLHIPGSLPLPYTMPNTSQPLPPLPVTTCVHADPVAFWTLGQNRTESLQ